MADELSHRRQNDGAAATSAPPSIAVLPFADLSAEGKQDHLGDGLAEEVRADLSRLAGLGVATRASAFALRNRPIEAPEAGRKLGVDAVLSGTIDRTGGVLAVGATLLDVGDGTTRWAKQFDGGTSDLLTIQQEIVEGVAKALHIRLSDTRVAATGRPATPSATAYEHYLRGRQLFFGSNRKSIDAATETFNRAIVADPSYALAYAGLAHCYAYLFMYFDPRPDNLKFSRNASTHALALDHNLAEAHAARGLAVSLSQRYEEAEDEFEAAIRLDPSLFEAHYFYARTCFAQGKYEAACRLYEAASEANHDDAQALTLLGFTYRTMGEDELANAASTRALARLERLLELNPDDPRATYLSADALLQLGHPDAALRRAERAAALDPEDPYALYGLTCIYSQLQMVDKGIDALRRAVAYGFGHKAWIANDSDLDALRQDPRFQNLMKELE